MQPYCAAHTVQRTLQGFPVSEIFWKYSEIFVVQESSFLVDVDIGYRATLGSTWRVVSPYKNCFLKKNILLRKKIKNNPG